MEDLKKEIIKLIKVYEVQKKGYDSMIDEYNEKGIENLDFVDTENYGVFLGKSELFESVINDLKEINS